VKRAVVIVGITLFYAFFSTIFYDTDVVGDVGRVIGHANLHLFGALAYINILFLFYPLYYLYRAKPLEWSFDGAMGWLLGILALLMLQALLFDGRSAGTIGTVMIKGLKPSIGLLGVWLLMVMMGVIASFLILGEERLHAFFSTLLTRQPKESLEEEDLLLQESHGGIWERFYTFITTHPFASPLGERGLMPELKTIEFDQKPRYMEEEPEQLQRRVKYQKEPLPKEQEGLSEDVTTSTQEEPTRREKLKNPTSTSSPLASIEPASVVKKERVVEKERTVEHIDSLEENTKALAQIETGKREKPKNFKLPKISFLERSTQKKRRINELEIDCKIEELLSKLGQFKVEGDVVRTYSGPLVTTFEFKPAPNVKVSKILGLQDDLAMALSAETIRIQAPIPGRDVVGIEIPNETIETIYLRDILEAEIFQNSSSPLTVALGKDIVGKPFVTDLKKLPHLLIAGTTGSGKSVGINAMILSLLYRNDPDALKLMLIDPKMLEFSMYNDIPHLITPVITEPAKAIAALANMVGEMERRYKLMAKSRTKNIENYNEKAKKEGVEPFPFIVIVIDELADLMMNGGKEVELSIARLAQKSRACGIHLVVATQRPSVDVVTGLIKANLPSRLSYRVGSRIDSKVILDALGADSLLGRGDGLFTPPATTGLIRIHAPWNSEEEIDRVVAFLKKQRLPEYDESYLVVGGALGESGGGSLELDPLFEEAKMVVLNDKKTSISYLQRKLQIGYNRSANIIEQLEQEGVLSPANAKGQREIL
jgi:S-DNA-T family DNA segregation ATPase FtsK/SpoIIIE